MGVFGNNDARKDPSYVPDVTMNRSDDSAFRRSGLDVSFGTMMKWMHRGDKTGTEKISSTAVQGVIGKVELAFPGALPSHRMAKQASKLLAAHGYTKDNTLVATSLCCDELNRCVEEEISGHFGPAYNMGGLAGFCFGGVVGFGNMAHHVPSGGNCLVLYGPHVGIDWDQEVGKVNRLGHEHGSNECCGPASLALDFCRKVKSGERAEADFPRDIIESQQTWVCKELLPLVDRIEKAEDPKIELPLALYDAQDEIMGRIVTMAGGEMGRDTGIALLGGVTINTPEGTPEYFLPKKFVVVNSDGKVQVDLLDELLSAKAPLPSRLNKKSIMDTGTKTYG